MFCHKCGNQTIDGADFCSKCGEKLIKEDSANEEKIIENTEKAENPVIEEELYDVIITDISSLYNQRVTITTMIKECAEISLKEARDLADQMPTTLVKGVSAAKMEHIKDILENKGVGAIINDQNGQEIYSIAALQKSNIGTNKNSDNSSASVNGSINSESKSDASNSVNRNYVKELIAEFPSLEKKDKAIIIGIGVLALVVIIILIRLMFISAIAMIAIPAGIYFIYQMWLSKYFTEMIYSFSKELKLPEASTPQTLLESLSGKFNYPYFKEVRYGTDGECIIEGKYGVYPIKLSNIENASLKYENPSDGSKVRLVVREAITIRSYLNKFFNPTISIDTAKEMKALKSAEWQSKTTSFIFTAAMVLLIIVGVISSMDSNGALSALKPGAEVRNAYLTRYSDSVTVEKAFDNFFENGKWSTYESEGYSYVVFTGTCEYLDEKADVKVKFKITGENFVVDSMDLNGQTQSDLILLALLSKVYEDYD